MINPLLIGTIAGMRAMTPLAVVANAASRGELAADNGAPAVLRSKWIAAGTLVLAAGEFVGDKTRSAPDRTVMAGLAARTINAAIAGAALSPRRNRAGAAMAAGVAAIGSSYLTLNLRRRAIPIFGHSTAGIVEDGLALVAALLIVRRAR